MHSETTPYLENVKRRGAAQAPRATPYFPLQLAWCPARYTMEDVRTRLLRMSLPCVARAVQARNDNIGHTRVGLIPSFLVAFSTSIIGELIAALPTAHASLVRSMMTSRSLITTSPSPHCAILSE
eukprot:scaffold1618_cov397-Prasinococcus_capsulatus_cf.AAC.24